MVDNKLNAVVTQKVDVSPEVMILRIVPVGVELKEFIPGQFTVLGLPGSFTRINFSDPETAAPDPQKLICRTYSVASSSKSKEYIEFFIALVRSGSLTPRLFNLKIGDKLWFSGNFKGLFTLKDVPFDNNVIFIATGTGLSPYMSMLRSEITTGLKNKIAIIHGARHSWDLGYRSELFTMQRLCPYFNYFPVISMPEEEPVKWTGLTGFIHDIWNKNIITDIWGFPPSPLNTHIFLCGNPLMIEKMLPLLDDSGFKEYSNDKKGQIHTERFLK